MICFDMDGTIADLYAIEDWFNKLRNSDPSPYETAKPMLNMSLLARLLHKVQKAGYEIAIISWVSKDTTEEYAEQVNRAKRQWLAKHLPSVAWDSIEILPYGAPKNAYGRGILFDDNEAIRAEWGETAYPPEEIFNVLKSL